MGEAFDGEATTASDPKPPGGRHRKAALPDSPGLVTHREVAAKIGVPCETLRAWIDKGSFPAPHAAFQRTLLYRADFIGDWLVTGKWPAGVRYYRARVGDEADPA